MFEQKSENKETSQENKKSGSTSVLEEDDNIPDRPVTIVGGNARAPLVPLAHFEDGTPTPPIQQFLPTQEFRPTHFEDGRPTLLLHFEDALFNPPVAVATHPEVKRSYSTSKLIDSAGGRLKLCECDVSIPRDALTHSKNIKLDVRFVKWNQNYEGDWMLFGPNIILGPSGTSFAKPVVITIASCYHSVQGSQPIAVKVETGTFWDEHEQTTLDENGKFSFSVKHFSPFRFLLRMLGSEKSIAHMSFTRRNNDENEYEMIWCFCDNVREAKMEVQKEMALQDFNLTKSTETFTIRSDDDIKISVEIPDSAVDPQFKRISVDDLWSADSVVKAEFIIGNLRDGSRITYKIDLIKSGQNQAHSSKVNAFTFRPDTGNIDAGAHGGATVLNHPVIDTMVFPQ